MNVPDFAKTNTGTGSVTVAVAVTGVIWSLSAVAVLSFLPAAMSAAVIAYEPVQVCESPGASVGIGFPPGHTTCTSGSATLTFVSGPFPALLTVNVYWISSPASARPFPLPSVNVPDFAKTNTGTGSVTVAVAVTGAVWSLSAVAVLSFLRAAMSAAVIAYEPVQVCESPGASVGIGFPPGHTTCTSGSATLTFVSGPFPALLTVNVYWISSPASARPFPLPSVNVPDFAKTNTGTGSVTVAVAVTGAVWSLSAVAVLSFLRAAMSAAVIAYGPVQVCESPGASVGIGFPPGHTICTSGSATLTFVSGTFPALLTVNVYWISSPASARPFPLPSVNVPDFAKTNTGTGSVTVAVAVTGAVWSLSAVAVLSFLRAAMSAAVIAYEPVQVCESPGASVGIGFPPGHTICTSGSATRAFVSGTFPALLTVNVYWITSPTSARPFPSVGSATSSPSSSVNVPALASVIAGTAP